MPPKLKLEDSETNNSIKSISLSSSFSNEKYDIYFIVIQCICEQCAKIYCDVVQILSLKFLSL